jgi:flagellar basal body-associated protein FliL
MSRQSSKIIYDDGESLDFTNGEILAEIKSELASMRSEYPIWIYIIMINLIGLVILVTFVLTVISFHGGSEAKDQIDTIFNMLAIFKLETELLKNNTDAILEVLDTLCPPP